jgi:peptidoglycan-associated lipoprotein
MMVASIVLLTTSCGKQTMQNQSGTVSQAEVPAKPDIPQPEQQQVEASVMAKGPEVTETEFVAETIYFGFDSAELSGKAPQLLNNMAEYMRSNPGLELKVQGHCDERGTDTRLTSRC